MRQLEFFVELNGQWVKSFKNSLQKAVEYAQKFSCDSENCVCIWDNYANMYDPENYRHSPRDYKKNSNL